jgi:hypothetical protein
MVEQGSFAYSRFSFQSMKGAVQTDILVGFSVLFRPQNQKTLIGIEQATGFFGWALILPWAVSVAVSYEYFYSTSGHLSLPLRCTWEECCLYPSIVV